MIGDVSFISNFFFVHSQFEKEVRKAGDGCNLAIHFKF